MNYQEEIEAEIRDDRVPVTLKSFSRKFELSYKESSRILEEFVTQTKIPVVCFYMLTGLKHNGEFLTTLTTKCKIDAMSKGLMNVKCHPYALMKSSSNTISDLYYKSKDDLIHCTKSQSLPISFAYKLTLRNTEEKLPVISMKNSASPIKSPVPTEKDNINIIQSKDIPNEKTEMFKTSKPEPRNERKKKILPRSDALANLFAKQVVKDKEQKTKEANTLPEPMVKACENSSPDILVESESKKRKKKHTKNVTKTYSKRKRIVAVSDSSSSEDEMMENSGIDADDIEMPPVSGAEQNITTVHEDEKSNVEDGTKCNRKCRKRTLKPKSYLGDDGFMETKWEYESEEIEEDEVVEEKKELSPIKIKTEESKKSKVISKDRKQASITSFFSKR